MTVVAPSRLVVLVILAIAAFAGCGGDDEGDAQAQISKTLQAGLTTNDPLVLCRQSLSSGLIARIYGSVERCLAVERAASASRRPAGSADVSDIVVDGDHGTAVVAMRGGDQDGARGAVVLVRKDGDWQLEDFSTAFLRSGFSAGISGGDADANLTRCVGKKVVGLDDASLRQLAFGAMGGRPEAQAQLRELVGACIRELSAPTGGEVA